MKVKAKKSIIDYILSYSKKQEKEHVKAEEKTLPRKVTEKAKIKITRNIWDLTGKIVVIAEKPKAANKIALALSKNPIRKSIYGIPYYMIKTKNGLIIVASAAGHLYGLHTDQYGYPVFRYEWKPLYQIGHKAKHTKKFITALSKLCSNADYYVNACDYDIEGSVIGYLIIYFHGDLEKSLRAKFSSLTIGELRESFRKLTSLDWEMIEAGLCRHELDWIWGINISRALMSSVKMASGKRVILSAGRVQTPTLRYIVEKDIERRLFIPLPQYSLSINISKNNYEIHVEYKGKAVETKKKAKEIIKDIKNTGYLTVKKYEEKKYWLNPPPAFNLGDLQEEAARIYRFSPYKTQSIAEKLYLDALISYPRTNSQKLPPTLNYKGIMNKLSRINNYKELISNLLVETRGVLKPVQGPKDDPAHPAIYPTGVKPKDLGKDEWKIYDLIVRRFLAAFASRARISHRIVYLEYPKDPSMVFMASGRKILELGWLRYYPFSMPEERFLPRFQHGEKVKITKASIRKTYTKPPEKISRIKILRWMENVGIGTEATRARIIEILFNRKYLRSVGGRVEATDLGLGIIEVLMEYFPEITSVSLTRYFEGEMEKIRLGIRRRDEVVRDAKNTLIKLIVSFDKKKYQIGKTLSYRLGYLTPTNKCMLCNREAYKNNLCKYHYQALNTIVKTYEEWKRREGVDWDKYLSSIKKLKSTGKWIVEVIQNFEKIKYSHSK
ncbi:DNA topoisomerase I [Staphylothermus hellenicus]|uniref:DNA topoisomerase 1 n=1 Tax=Staphylothermus hellenicus (strain DSM 12710 / JCM 10830 / BK20S6-10-b1 / P8) TaxID=591019 RepID=D7D935_STAHD|nr:DNA topoisomerase I [Staphylothermus hellenicus]ADI32281.1 DNA topoisomerase I [Staphylothermus hellenicus DSM 12710]